MISLILYRYLRRIKNSVLRPHEILALIVVFPILVRAYLQGKQIILVTRHGGIGDLICIRPALGGLRNRIKRAFIVLETKNEYQTLVSRFPEVQLVIEHNSLPAAVCRRLISRNRQIKLLLPDEKCPKEHRERIHLSEEFCRAAGITSLVYKTPLIIPDAATVDLIYKKLNAAYLDSKCILVIHTGPTWKVKEWPLQHWDKLIALIHENFQITVIQIGEDRTATGERRKSPEISGAVNWVGKLTIVEMMALMKICNLFIGIDSGMLHLAGAVGAPVIGLFGPTAAECFLPKSGETLGLTASLDCISCHHACAGPLHWESDCPNQIECMNNLQPDVVYTKLIGFIQKIGITPISSGGLS